MFVCTQLLVSGQPYEVTIHLELPESPINMELGMFMVNLSFYSSEGRAVSSSARPVSRYIEQSMLSY